MLFKSLSRWLNDSLNLLESKTIPPNDYVELKSLIADLKTFRLEEYANKQREKKKLHHIYSELQVSSSSCPRDSRGPKQLVCALQNFFSKQLSPAVDANEEMRVIDRLWERLDQAISSRESQLEATIGKYDKMQKTYEHLNKDIKRLTSNLNTLKDQLGVVSDH